jgi:hypothetical protein
MPYNLAYLQAVVNGFTRQEAIAAAEEACDRAAVGKVIAGLQVIR